MWHAAMSDASLYAICTRNLVCNNNGNNMEIFYLSNLCHYEYFGSYFREE